MAVEIILKRFESLPSIERAREGGREARRRRRRVGRWWEREIWWLITV